MNPSTYDQIAFLLAKEVGFDCFFQRQGEYALRKDNAGCCGPAFYGKAAGPNPCHEVPLGFYQLCLEIDGATVSINGCIHFDLNDPASIDQFKAEFRDLQALTDKIEAKLYPKNKNVGEPGYMRFRK